MKIAFVLHELIRGHGQGRINYEIARHALAAGHEVVLLADRVAPELVEWGATWVPVSPPPHRPHLVFVPRFASAADRRLGQLPARPDVVVAAGVTMWGAHDVSMCQFVHGAWMKSPAHDIRLGRGPRAWYQAAYARANARWERRAYAAAGVVVAPSDRVRGELQGVGVPGDKIRVVFNGVDPGEFFPGPQPRAELGLPDGVPLALFVGDIRTGRKNLGTVLKALARVPDVHLAVVGAADASPFPAVARALGVADRVHFAGFRKDVPAFMRACDLFVFPTRYEPFGLVVLEALSCGLPVVTTRAAGAAEVMGDGDGRIVADPEDVAALAAAVAAVAGNRGAPGVRAGAARDIAERNSWARMAGRYLDLFREVAGRSRRPASLVTAG